MDQVQVVVEHRGDMPGGVPALWEIEGAPCGSGFAATVTLYLRDDLPQLLADGYRAMCVRDCMPDEDFDAFTATPHAMRVRELTAAV